MMDILEDINAEHNHLNAVAWFKKLCIVIFLITLCAGFFIYYKNSVDKKNLAQDTLITDQIILNYLNPKEQNNATYQNFLHKRPASDILKLSEVHSLIKHNEKIKAQEELCRLVTNTQSDFVSAVARLTWMSLALDMENTNPNKQQFETYLSYFEDSQRLFWGRANILGAIFLLKNNQISKAKELLTKVMYSSSCTTSTMEEAKAVLLLINSEEQNKG